VCSPEPIDIDLSKKMVEAGAIIGIQVADLIMVTPGGYYSFKEKGLL
jgi:DNA repair protein RadC